MRGPAEPFGLATGGRPPAGGRGVAYCDDSSPCRSGVGGVPGSLVGDASVAPGRLAVPLTPPPRPRARTVVRLRGELTSSRAPHVRRKLLRAFARSPSILEVDLGEALMDAPPLPDP